MHLLSILYAPPAYTTQWGACPPVSTKCVLDRQHGFHSCSFGNQVLIARGYKKGLAHKFCLQNSLATKFYLQNGLAPKLSLQNGLATKFQLQLQYSLATKFCLHKGLATKLLMGRIPPECLQNGCGIDSTASSCSSGNKVFITKGYVQHISSAFTTLWQPSSTHKTVQHYTTLH